MLCEPVCFSIQELLRVLEPRLYRPPGRAGDTGFDPRSRGDRANELQQTIALVFYVGSVNTEVLHLVA